MTRVLNVRRWVLRVLDWIAARDAAYRQARRAMELDEHLLRDIGATREELLMALRRHAGRKSAGRISGDGIAGWDRAKCG